MRFSCVVLVFYGLLSIPVSAAPGLLKPSLGQPIDDPAVHAFIEEVASRRGLARADLRALFAQAKYTQEVLDAFARPAESKPWYTYRRIFLTPSRIKGGVAFWRENTVTLSRAESEFGVPAHVIAAIIGVETNYGRHKGRLRVLDSLTTLAFKYPRRAKFFRRELEALLLLKTEENLPVRSVKGSYAGAVGFPQFIPTSYRSYSVDFDGDGRKDLLGSLPDAIGSVGNYLKRHRWRANAPVARRVTGVTQGDPRLAHRSLKPRHSVRSLVGSGIRPVEGTLPNGKVSLLAFEVRSGSEYWIGYSNFYAITRYNPSKLYAMAIYQLALAIRQAHANPK